MAKVNVTVLLRTKDKAQIKYQDPPAFHGDYDAEERWYDNNQGLEGVELEVSDLEVVDAMIRELNDARKIIANLSAKWV